MYTQGKRTFTNFKFPVFIEINDDFNKLSEDSPKLILSYLKKGQAIVESNGNRYTLVGPSIILINEEAHFNMIENIDADFTSIYFHPKYINIKLNFTNIRENKDSDLTITDKQDAHLLSVFGKDNRRINVIELNSFTEKQYSSYFSKIKQNLQEQESLNWACWARSWLMSMLFFIDGMSIKSIENLKLVIPNTEYNLQDVFYYLYANYKENITIQSIAEHFGTNRTTLNTRFKDEYGTTIIKFLKRIRIESASRMLRNTILSVTEIALDVGYNDISNFTRVFKQVHGVSPSAYRNMHSHIPYKTRFSHPALKEFRKRKPSPTIST